VDDWIGVESPDNSPCLQPSHDWSQRYIVSYFGLAFRKGHHVRFLINTCSSHNIFLVENKFSSWRLIPMLFWLYKTTMGLDMWKFIRCFSCQSQNLFNNVGMCICDKLDIRWKPGAWGHLYLLLQWQDNWNLHWVCINMKILCPQWLQRAHCGCLLVIMGAKRHIHILCWKRVLIHVETFVCIEHNWFDIFFIIGCDWYMALPIHTPWIYSKLEMKRWLGFWQLYGVWVYVSTYKVHVFIVVCIVWLIVGEV
jgi:hypothetical protein